MTVSSGGTTADAPSEQPAGTASPRARRPKDRRATIERVATELFAEHGYATTGVGDIALQVGITPGALYRHFKNKEALLQSILSGCLGSFLDALEPLPEAEPYEQLEHAVRSTVRLAHSHAAQVSTYLQTARSLPEAAREELHAGEQKLADEWKKLIRTANPTLTPADAAARRRALNGVLGLLARQPEALVKRRLESLFTQSTLSMLLAPAPVATRTRTKKARRTWSPPRSRRQQIRDTGAALIRQHGYHGVGIDQIGKAAGLSGPTVYSTYDSKSDILVDASDHAIAKVELALEDALEAATSADEAISLIARSYTATVYANADIVAIATREDGSLPQADRLRNHRRRTDFRQVCAAVLMQVRTDLAEAEAMALVAAGTSAIQEVSLLHRNRPSEAAAVALVEHFVRADLPTEA
ncbi:TetR/AcrR family transcriptional regulator [Streptomyces sp. NPDC048527]|uniref:TetR/AcrR family transcriptional regulator n=1 Tax=Streptomyces sp. NPDC048527 TaxID=3365568 RepID=UPI00371EC8A1